MTEPTLYRIVDDHPYFNLEDEYGGLTLEAAATKLEDLTGEHASQIIADVEEDADVLPWRWVDDESGREVVMRLEVE